MKNILTCLFGLAIIFAIGCNSCGPNGCVLQEKCCCCKDCKCVDCECDKENRCCKDCKCKGNK